MAAVSWISDCNDFSFFFIYKLPRYFLPSFESNGPSVQEMKGKIDIQDSRHGIHLGFQIRAILAIFLSTNCPDISYKVLSQLAFPFRIGRAKQILKMGTMAAILDFRSEGF